jgi:hypothetical protein
MKIALTALAMTLLTPAAFGATANVNQVEVQPGALVLVLNGQRMPVCLNMPEAFRGSIMTIALTAKAQNKPIAYRLAKSIVGDSKTCINSIAF